jgi:hypothetical protein
MSDERMEIDAAMRLTAVQVQRHRKDRELGDDERERDPGAPGRLGQTARSEREQGIEHERNNRKEYGKDRGTIRHAGWGFHGISSSFETFVDRFSAGRDLRRAGENRDLSLRTGRRGSRLRRPCAHGRRGALAGRGPDLNNRAP